MEHIEKKLEEITRNEWIAFQWVEIPPTMGDDGERVFIPRGRRTPDEAMDAMESWDVTAEERDCELEEKGVVQ
jgi:hypothetical protein